MSEHEEGNGSERDAPRGGFYDVLDGYVTKDVAEGRHDRTNKLIVGLGERLLKAEEQIDALQRLVGEESVRLRELKDRKIEIGSNLVFTTPVIIGAILFTAALVGGQKWATAGVSSQLQDTNSTVARIVAAAEAKERLDEARVKLEDERAANQRDAITNLRGSVAMVDTKLNNLMINTATNNQRKQ